MVRAVVTSSFEFCQLRIFARRKAKGCTLPKILKFFYFAFFGTRSKPRKVTVYLIGNYSCKFGDRLCLCVCNVTLLLLLRSFCTL